MTRATKFEMDEKLNKMKNLIMSFMDCTNNKIKLMEEEIKQNKNKINILENELNETKTNNQEYKHKIHVSENDHIYDINKKLDEIVSYKISEMNEKMVEIDQHFDYMDEKIAERLDEHTEDTDDKITEKLNEIYDKCNQKLDELDRSINTHEELIHKITGLETQFQESKDKITGLETEVNILNTHNTNINDQLINFKELITDHVTQTELEQTVNRCVAFQHLSTVTNREYDPCNSDIGISGVNSTTLKFNKPVMCYYDITNPSKGSYNLPQDYYLKTIKCNGIYYNYIPKHGYIFNSNSKKIDRGNIYYYPAGIYDLKTHSIEFYN